MISLAGLVHDTEREKAVAGVPTAYLTIIVRLGGSCGSVFELFRIRAISELNILEMPDFECRALCCLVYPTLTQFLPFDLAL